MGAQTLRPALGWLLPLLAAAAVLAAGAAEMRGAVPADAPKAAGTIAPEKETPEADMPPAELHIGAVDFKVEMKPFPDSYAGMTHFKEKTIQIDPAAASETRRRVYLHELMHVAWHQGRAPADKARLYTEEEAIQELAPGLLKLLAENPQAVDYLRKPLPAAASLPR